MATKKIIKKKETEEKIPARKVQFAFPAPEAQEVYLAGDFNHWNPRENPMKKDRQGIWKTTLPLKPGRYECRIHADGNWENDPFCSCCVPNDFGSKNCVRIVDN